MQQCKRYAGLAAVTLVLAACSDEPAAPRPSLTATSVGAAIPPVSEYRTYDDELLAIAKETPSFGGVYFDSTGAVVVFVTDLATSASAGAAVSARFRGRSGDGLLPTAAAPAMRFVKGEFDWPTLKRWKDSLRLFVFRDSAVSFIDADEGANRVTIGVTNTTAEARIRELARSMGAPAILVRIVIEAKASPRVTLSGNFNPKVGGLKITFPGAGGTYSCSLGFIASYNYLGNRALVTNSHCTGTMFQNTGTPISQAGLVIGTEANDTPLFQVNGGCPAGRWCRNSDAAVILLSSGVASQYGIAFTGVTPPSPCVNQSCSSQINISGIVSVTGDGWPTQGQTLNKTGAASGWTRGTVTNTCADTPGDALNYPPAGGVITPLLLCQIHTTLWSTYGDSGSPVYARYTDVAGQPGEASLYGIMWGGPADNFNVTWVSPIAGINFDVGALVYF